MLLYVYVNLTGAVPLSMEGKENQVKPKSGQ